MTAYWAIKPRYVEDILISCGCVLWFTNVYDVFQLVTGLAKFDGHMHILLNTYAKVSHFIM